MMMHLSAFTRGRGMTTEEKYTFRDDLPKMNPWQDDRLGYKPFCERLAKIIINLNAPNGYVIGLHGQWGSGKSTALNFVRAFLVKNNQENDKDKITLVDFQPWIISGHQDLIAAFFKVMTDNLGVRPSWLTRQRNALMRALKIGGDPLVDAIDAAAKIALTMDPSVGVASKAMAAVTKKSISGMVDKFLADPSLQTAYEELRKRLDESHKRFLVIIDDLDRLQKHEILAIMQMVKTVGRLPNVIYVLAYDRRIVWQALETYNEKERPHFAEKIVQQEIELPLPSKEELLSILDSEINFLFGATPATLRWHYIVRDGVRRWVRNARDVIRLANAAKFSWPALKDEFDPQDLLAMEGLRLFDPAAFEWIRWNRDFLFAQGRFMMSSEDAQTKHITALSARLPESTRDEVLQLMTLLFPGRANYFQNNRHSSQESHQQVVRRRGIGCEPGYDAFFGLHPSSEAIPKAVIDLIVSVCNDEEAIVRTIGPYLGRRDRAGQPMVSQLLEELRFRFEARETAKPTQSMLDAMFRIGEDVFRIDYATTLFALSPRSHVTLLVAELLKAWGSEEAGKRLISAFDKSKSPGFSADIFVDRARELGLIETDSRSLPLITKNDLDALGTILLHQIEKAAEDGTLANAPFYWDIGRAWKYLGDATKAKTWFTAGMNANAEFLAKVTLGFVSYSLSSQEPVYEMSQRPDPDLYNLSAIQTACRKHLAATGINRDQRTRIQVVAQAVEELLNAHSPEPEIQG